jgi:hypothetical protein
MNGQAFFEHRVFDGQREQEAHHVAVHAAAQQQQTGLLRALLHELGEVGVRCAVGAVEVPPPPWNPGRARRRSAVALASQAIEPRHQGWPRRSARSHSFSSSITSSTAMGRGDGQRVAGVGAAQAAGGRRVHDLGAATHGRQRHAAGQALGQGDQVGHHAVVLHGEQLAGAAKPVWISSAISTMPCVVAQRAQR